jgi:hypothetical protein
MLLTPLALALLPYADETPQVCRPGQHAPAGVMDLHCPMDREWMVSLTTSYTRYEGLRDHAHRVSTDEALGLGYAQVPQSMDMTMVMLDAMYAASDTLTLEASLPWISNSMRMRTNLGEEFTMDSSGIGDAQVGANVVVWQHADQKVSVGLGLSMPSGSITETGGMPGQPATQMEYAMQLGSGTWDFVPRADWRMHTDAFDYGISLSGVVHNGHNDRDYALGDRFEGSAWGTQDWSPTWAGTLRLSVSSWSNVRGADPALDPMMSPTNDPGKQGGERVDAAVGVNWLPFEGELSGSVVGLEIGAPLSQNLDGPQLSEDWFASLHIGFSF